MGEVKSRVMKSAITEKILEYMRSTTEPSQKVTVAEIQKDIANLSSQNDILLIFQACFPLTPVNQLDMLLPLFKPQNSKDAEAKWKELLAQFVRVAETHPDHCSALFGNYVKEYGKAEGIALIKQLSKILEYAHGVPHLIEHSVFSETERMELIKTTLEQNLEISILLMGINKQSKHYQNIHPMLNHTIAKKLEYLEEIVPDIKEPISFVRHFKGIYAEFYGDIQTTFVKLNNPVTLGSAAQAQEFVHALSYYLKRENVDAKKRAMIFRSYLQHALLHHNAALIHTLKQFSADYAASSVGLDEDNRIKLAELEAVKNVYAYSRYMPEYLGNLGKISYDGALLTVAQIAERKSDPQRNQSQSNMPYREQTYEFDPTILKGDQFENYLKLLKSTPPPIRERFVLAGPTHWFSGEIRIHDAKVEILFLEPLQDSTDPTEFVRPCLEIFDNVFQDTAERHIYLELIMRQYSEKGCSVFALDDVRHLYTIDRYLPEPFKDLFEYLRHHGKNTFQIKHQRNPAKTIIVNEAQLPLAMMRTTQSTKLIAEPKGIIRSRSDIEQSTPVKKQRYKGEQGLTAMGSVQKHFINDERNKLINRRIEYKLKSMGEENKKYIESHSPEVIENAMKQFTLTTLSERLNRKSLPYRPSLKE